MGKPVSGAGSGVDSPTPRDESSGKKGKGAGSQTGGVSGGKATGGTERKSKNDNSSGKGSGNR
jgi:hypothetical protein